MNPIRWLLVAARVWLVERKWKPAPDHERRAVENALRERRIRGLD